VGSLSVFYQKDKYIMCINVFVKISKIKKKSLKNWDINLIGIQKAPTKYEGITIIKYMSLFSQIQSDLISFLFCKLWSSCDETE